MLIEDDVAAGTLAEEPSAMKKLNRERFSGT
jgi:hypothetical protein